MSGTVSKMIEAQNYLSSSGGHPLDVPTHGYCREAQRRVREY